MKALFKIALFSTAFFGFIHAASAQVNFGVKAGLNLANVFVDPKEDPNPSMVVTFQAGAIADINISDNFAIQPGLLLVGKGFKVDFDFLGTNFKSTSNPFYLQVPVNFLYKGKMFYAGAGPYAAFGLFGKNKTEGGGDSDSQDISFGNDVDDNYAPLDFGVNVEAGVDLPANLRIGAGYALGLSNVISEANRGDTSIKHGVISVNVAYMFGGGDK